MLPVLHQTSLYPHLQCVSCFRFWVGLSYQRPTQAYQFQEPICPIAFWVCNDPIPQTSVFLVMICVCVFWNFRMTQPHSLICHVNGLPCFDIVVGAVQWADSVTLAFKMSATSVVLVGHVGDTTSEKLAARVGQTWLQPGERNVNTLFKTCKSRKHHIRLFVWRCRGQHIIDLREHTPSLIMSKFVFF